MGWGWGKVLRGGEQEQNGQGALASPTLHTQQTDTKRPPPPWSWRSPVRVGGYLERPVPSDRKVKSLPQTKEVIHLGEKRRKRRASVTAYP